MAQGVLSGPVRVNPGNGGKEGPLNGPGFLVPDSHAQATPDQSRQISGWTIVVGVTKIVHEPRFLLPSQHPGVAPGILRHDRHREAVTPIGFLDGSHEPVLINRNFGQAD